MPPANKQPTPPATLPTHVAIIMDGNGRWAKQRGLPRLEGHRRGAKAVRSTLTAAFEAGVKYLTLYAFSVENWKRPQDEVGGLMRLLNYFLKQELKTLQKNKISLHTIGRTDALPPSVRKELAATIKATAHHKDRALILALNYGSRTEIADAVAAYARAVAAGKENPDDVSWDAFARHLYTAGIPDPDLVIRTSGETRVSNFLLMQSAYAEFIFTPVLWPDFGKAELLACLAEYAKRERRFGQTGEQVAGREKSEK
ncbi:undecaprenyl diphosphate synthase [Ereboglobus sp. PH5-10]|uniref:isoprenyl transferase n=1 Tax=Ereboglobus sp. PH5-10 TaxID=2940629 RepID=UPI0024056104|nr:isoprenyl transferase [Ereboglobus sp. PH5-10]MDF9828491.1 undecaprenyl diphosphate synthase [Ereboglobus sp. PH5-10]